MLPLVPFRIAPTGRICRRPLPRTPPGGDDPGMAPLVPPPRPDAPPAPTGPAGALRPVLVRFTATVIAGVFTGLVAGGIGGRLAMLVLRLTTGDSVHGV